MEIKEIDKEQVLAQFNQALEHCESGRCDLAAESLESVVATLEQMVAMIDHMLESAGSEPGPPCNEP